MLTLATAHGMWWIAPVLGGIAGCLFFLALYFFVIRPTRPQPKRRDRFDT